MTIREIMPTDYHLLEDFIYHAIHVLPGQDIPGREIIKQPDISIYVKDFDADARRGDCGIIAELDGKPIGMAWTRIIDGYGHIDNGTPELAVSVLPQHRGKGYGAQMMQLLFEALRARGFTQTSLAVQKTNPAAQFYTRLGYEIIGKNAEEWIMLKRL
ncbi:MAG: GNAT family N-acetyltransferase [Defluviitaleaceae bacterium]|nr:GNAT family N-acetyltransferase [Defluviitaleaceae bacterium]